MRESRLVYFRHEVTNCLFVYVFVCVCMCAYRRGKRSEVRRGERREERREEERGERREERREKWKRFASLDKIANIWKALDSMGRKDESM